jgi:hypothetical protein
MLIRTESIGSHCLGTTQATPAEKEKCRSIDEFHMQVSR